MKNIIIGIFIGITLSFCTISKADFMTGFASGMILGDDSSIGKTIKCPKCHNEFELTEDCIIK